MNRYRLIVVSSQNKCLLQQSKEVNAKQDVHRDPMHLVECNEINKIIKALCCPLKNIFLVEAR